MSRRLAVMSGAALHGIALSLLLSANAQPVVMPTRRPELEPGFDMNGLLDDAGNREKRKARKADRKARMQDLQRAAVEGRS